MNQKMCYETLRIRSILFFAYLITLTSTAQEVPCESINSGNWGANGYWKTCYMINSTVIDASDFTISTPRDETVQGLSLIGNKKVKFLPLETAEKFPNLIGLSGMNCSIKTIKKENFQNLNKLKWIWLSLNQIETIYSDTFQGLSSLEEISLANNRISQMNGETFAGLNNLYQVQLYGNRCIDDIFLDRSKIAALIRMVSEKCWFSERLITIEVSAIRKLEAERDAAKIAQKQAEAQALIFKDLFETIYFKYNQTCAAKIEELQNQVVSKKREIEGLLREQQSLKVDNKNSTE